MYVLTRKWNIFLHPHSVTLPTTFQGEQWHLKIHARGYSPTTVFHQGPAALPRLSTPPHGPVPKTRFALTLAHGLLSLGTWSAWTACATTRHSQQCNWRAVLLSGLSDQDFQTSRRKLWGGWGCGAKNWAKREHSALHPVTQHVLWRYWDLKDFMCLVD